MTKYELRRLSFKAFGNIVGKHHKCYITKWVLYMSINYFQMKLPSKMGIIYIYMNLKKIKIIFK